MALIQRRSVFFRLGGGNHGRKACPPGGEEGFRLFLLHPAGDEFAGLLHLDHRDPRLFQGVPALDDLIFSLHHIRRRPDSLLPRKFCFSSSISLFVLCPTNKEILSRRKQY